MLPSLARASVVATFAVAALVLAALVWAIVGRDWASTEQTATPARPQRIVSVNPCLDALLVRIAPANRIAGISAYSHDPRATSLPMGMATRFPAIANTAEAIVAARPDLVLSTGPLAPGTARTLDQLGIARREFGLPQTIDESLAQIDELARATGDHANGRTFRRRIERELAQLAARPDARRLPALIRQRSGLVPGPPSLPDQLMRHVGLINAAAGYGIANWQTLPLEPVLANPPALLFTEIENGEATGFNARVIDRLRSTSRLSDFPERLLWCAGPSMVDAARALKAGRDAALKRPR